MKTLLINPNAPKVYDIGGMNAFPLGLGYIAAILEKDHDVSVVDIRGEKLDDASLRKRISETTPEVVGITSDSLAFQKAIEIAQIIKELNKDTLVVIGGPHASVLPACPLNYDCFDISVYGEGERTAAELWDKIEKGESWEDVEGIAFRGRDGIIINPSRALIENLDELPFPARDLFPMDKYDGESDLSVIPVYSVSTSRGCPFSCAFCSNNVVFGKKYRFRSAKSVVDEIELLIKKYNARGIYFREDLFTVNKKRVIETCHEIKVRGLKLKWECEARVDTVDEEMLSVMKEAGCELVWCGVESGSQETLDRLSKGITVAQVRQAYNLFRKIGIRAGASYIIGVPGETIDDIHETISFAEELKSAFADFNIFMAYPTSPLYEYVKQNKLYEVEIGHGILVPKTKEFDRQKLEKIRCYPRRKLNRKKLFVIALAHFKAGTLTPRRIIKGIKILLGL